MAGPRELCCRARVSEGRTWLTGCRERGARGFYGAPSPRQEGRRAVTLGDSHPVTPAPECRGRGGVGWRRSLTSVASSHPRPRPREGRGAAPPAPSRALRASLRSRCARTPRLNTPAASAGDLSSPDPLCRLFPGHHPARGIVSKSSIWQSISRTRSAAEHNSTRAFGKRQPGAPNSLCVSNRLETEVRNLWPKGFSHSWPPYSSPRPGVENGLL